MNRRVAGAAVGALVVILVVVLVLGAMLVQFVGDDTENDAGCGTGVGDVVPAVLGGGETVAGLDGAQLRNAATIISVGRTLGVAPRGWVVAVATARQEAGIRNLASRANPGSLVYPHDAVADGDHDSVGIFQQRDSWGSLAVRMDVSQSAALFYRALMAVPGWESMGIAEAAQAVQRSAFPSAYAQWETLARSVVEKIGGSDVDTSALAAVSDPACVAMTATGNVTYPIANGAQYDSHNYGNGGSLWAHGHTGTDFSVGCGTPVVAATGGRVIIDTSQGWAGTWLVQVSTGAGKLTTWYAHMQALSVTDGQTVTAGQQIGQVGALGNATGCHLHFEVHPHGGGIYEDGVDPSVWLAANVGKNLGGGFTITSPASSSGGGLRLATFNTLGASHTTAAGKAPGMASGAQRTVWAIELLDHYRVDVAGLQEFQSVQARTFSERAGSTYGMWHPDGDTENAVVWRTSSFEQVGADTITIPYFDGHPRRMPIVQLRDRATGQVAFFLNVHNPADTGAHPNQARYRAEAVRREVAAVRDLLARYNLPVFVTGDMNDRAEFYCPFTAPGNMTAAAGGSNAGGDCAPPPIGRANIDWILGSTGTRFADYTVDRSALVDRTSDHPFVVTMAQVD